MFDWDDAALRACLCAVYESNVKMKLGKDAFSGVVQFQDIWCLGLG